MSCFYFYRFVQISIIAVGIIDSLCITSAVHQYNGRKFSLENFKKTHRIKPTSTINKDLRVTEMNGVTLKIGDRLTDFVHTPNIARVMS